MELSREKCSAIFSGRKASCTEGKDWLPLTASKLGPWRRIEWQVNNPLFLSLSSRVWDCYNEIQVQPILVSSEAPQTFNARSSHASSSEEPALMAILLSSDDITLSRWFFSLSFSPWSVRFLRPEYKRHTIITFWMLMKQDSLAGNIPSLLWALLVLYTYLTRGIFFTFYLIL